MTNPCKTCEQAEKFPIGKTGKRHWYACRNKDGECDKHKEYAIKHEQFLDSKRMFRQSPEVIQSFEELLSQEWVWLFGKPKHREYIKSLQLRTVLDLLKSKRIHKVIKNKEV